MASARRAPPSPSLATAPEPVAPTAVRDLCRPLDLRPTSMAPADAWLSTVDDAGLLRVATDLAAAADRADEDLLRRCAAPTPAEEAAGGIIVDGIVVRHRAVPLRIASMRSGAWTEPTPGPWRAVGQQALCRLADTIAVRGRGDGSVTDAAMEAFLTGLERDCWVRASTLRARMTRGMPLPPDLGRIQEACDRRRPWCDVHARCVFDAGHVRSDDGRLARDAAAACADGRVRPGDLLALTVAVSGHMPPAAMPAVLAAMDGLRDGDPERWAIIAGFEGVRHALFRDRERWASCPGAWRVAGLTDAFLRVESEFRGTDPIASAIRERAGIGDAIPTVATILGVRSGHPGGRGALLTDVYDERGRFRSGTRDDPSLVEPLADPDDGRGPGMTPQGAVARPRLIAVVADDLTAPERAAVAAGLGGFMAKALSVAVGIHAAAARRDDGGAARDRDAAAAQFLHMMRHARSAIAAWGPSATAGFSDRYDAAAAAIATTEMAGGGDLGILAMVGAASGDAP